MTSLSRAAQAVMDAYGDFEAANTDAMAAALRAAADQVMSKPIRLPRNSYAEGAYDQRLNDRCQILAIAAELKGQ
jgi:hypothetical protein